MSSCQVSTALNLVPLQKTAWYAIHTRSRHEKRVVSELHRRGITTFLPLYSEVRQWSDRRMSVEVPLFSCYAFVNVDFSNSTRVEVLRTAGVLSFVGGNHQSISIADSEIETIQRLLANRVGVSYHPYLNVGQRVRLRGGALEGIEGILTRFNGSSRLVLSVETIQRSLSITVDGCDVEPIAPGCNVN
ncbi:MAG TPA: UpxY family transcription antiterminator [Terriglobales bacterium]|nr:UpxY family transcription antiterminator [Terriglobales bacterium]